MCIEAVVVKRVLQRLYVARIEESKCKIRKSKRETQAYQEAEWISRVGLLGHKRGNIWSLNVDCLISGGPLYVVVWKFISPL
jgi:hypothetical protein